MTEPRGLSTDYILEIHAAQLELFGGLRGVRDHGLLEASVARPINRWSYDEGGDALLAASYAFGICKNHPFVDGNKRTAFAAMMIFLRLNGILFAPDPSEAARVIISVAAGERSEEELAQWLEANWPSTDAKENNA